MRISFWDAAFRMAEKVRDSIEEKTGIHVWLTNNFSDADINYGNGNIKSSMNSPEFVGFTSHKYRFSKHLRANGFEDTPEFFRGVPDIFPCLVREHLDSYSGFGIHPFKNKEEYDTAHLTGEFWWTPFVTCNKEYRVHVLNGKFVKVYEKVPLQSETDLPIRNSYSLYHYSLRSQWANWSEMVALQNRLCPIIAQVPGSEFYALDFAWDPSGHRYFVFEGNSAPGLTDATASLYADHFINRLGIKVRSNVLWSDSATSGSGVN